MWKPFLIVRLQEDQKERPTFTSWSAIPFTDQPSFYIQIGNEILITVRTFSSWRRGGGSGALKLSEVAFVCSSISKY